ncbi:SusC/RagA family TonB-linked outer membrane protein [Ekhidna sp.]|uniref:SusC/RagA family TonB-linked outer membrane protein n=1 Tax=Ekhidna sp. TaxID=2608089 RepID=UPI003B500CA2
MKRILLLSFAFLTVVAFSAIAQRTVSGKVTDDTGEALPGVNVVIKGTTTGVTTDLDGNYRLSVDDGATLIFSYVGFETQEIQVGARSTIDVTLGGATELQEVVVTGYGTTSERKNVAAVDIVGEENINNVPLTDVNQIIQGRSPGVYTTAGSGQPGAAVDIRVRGTGSITAGRGPLYVIDGIIIENGDFTQLTETNDALANINPNDIANITVLKDAAATSLYGSRGANGVILINTKRGKSGKSTITARASVGVTRPNFGNMDMMDGDQVTKYERVVLRNGGRTEAQIDADRPLNPDSTFNWRDASFRDGVTRNYEIQAQGGNESTRYFLSGGYYKQDGTLIESSFDRYSVRANMDQIFNDVVDLTVNMNISYTDQLNATAGNRFSSPLLGAFVNTPLQNPINPNTGELYTGLEPEWAIFTGTNYLYEVPLNPVVNNNLRAIGKAELGINVKDNIRLSQTVAIDLLNSRESRYFDLTTNDGFDTQGQVDEAFNQNLVFTSQTKATGNWTFGSDHNLDALAVFEVQDADFEEFRSSGTGLASGKLKTLQSTATPLIADGSLTAYAFVSFLGQVNYNYQNKYYISFAGRRDGSSRFGADQRWANFFSVGGSWRLIEEDFLSGVSVLSNAKLRVSYGTSGNADIGNFASLGLYGFNTAYNNVPGSSPTQIANPALTWETTDNLNIGLDWGILDDRISGSVDVYRREARELLLDVPVSRTSGFATATQNLGKIRNEGIEVVLSTVNVRNGDFSWATDFNVAFNRNEILELNDGEDIINGSQVYSEGFPIRTWFIERWAGVNPADGTPLWYTEEGDLTGNYAEADRFKLGNAQPTAVGGLNNVVSYKNISLSAFFYFSLGNEVYNSSRRFIESDGQRYGWNHLTSAGQDFWQQPGDIAKRPQPIVGGNNAANSRSTRYLEDGSFVRLRNVQVSYSLPSEILSNVGAQSARVWLQGQNLLTFTNYSGFDPEMDETGSEFFRYPVGKTITVGLEVTF